MKLTDLLKNAFLVLVLALGGVSLTGCEDEGPMEEAGEEIDEAVDELEEEID